MALKNKKLLIIHSVAFLVVIIAGLIIYNLGKSTGKNQTSLSSQSTGGTFAIPQSSGIVNDFTNDLLTIDLPDSLGQSTFKINPNTGIRIADSQGVFQATDSASFKKGEFVVVFFDNLTSKKATKIDIIPAVTSNENQ